jgi:putrescine aminotransferase
LNSFHGKTRAAVNMGGKDVWRRWQEPIPNHAYVPFGDSAALEDEFKKNDVIMFIAEIIQGEGGIVVPHEEYFPKVRELCDAYDVYLVFDEIQSGSCRTGNIWAHQYFDGLVPDAFTFAKGISGGVLPVSGLQAKDSLYLAAYGDFDSAFMHTATYQDNNISATVALSALQFMLENDVPGHIRKNGDIFLGKLKALKEKYPNAITEIRGRGYMIGLVFGKDAGGEGYANRISKELALGHFIHTMTSPHNDTVMRIYPNYATSEEDFAWFLYALESTITTIIK